ncbi:MAG: hypothetical protein ACPGSB_03150 [Opitutales bacterium]
MFLYIKRPINPLRKVFCFFIIALVAIFFTACGKGGFSGLEALPVDEYLKSPGNFLGNTYVLSAQIDSQIKWEEGVGRILAVESEGSSARVPVFVPDSAGQNLHVGQRYEMMVSIRRGGLIYVEDLHKF